MASMIEIDVLYVVEDERHNTRTYGVTPDGIGMFWYDTREEAKDDLPEVYRTVYVTEEEFEELRREE